MLVSANGETVWAQNARHMYHGETMGYHGPAGVGKAGKEAKSNRRPRKWKDMAIDMGPIEARVEGQMADRSSGTCSVGPLFPPQMERGRANQGQADTGKASASRVATHAYPIEDRSEGGREDGALKNIGDGRWDDRGSEMGIEFSGDESTVAFT